MCRNIRCDVFFVYGVYGLWSKQSLKLSQPSQLASRDLTLSYGCRLKETAQHTLAQSSRWTMPTQPPQSSTRGTARSFKNRITTFRKIKSAGNGRDSWNGTIYFSTGSFKIIYNFNGQNFRFDQAEWSEGIQDNNVTNKLPVEIHRALEESWWIQISFQL